MSKKSEWRIENETSLKEAIGEIYQWSLSIITDHGYAFIGFESTPSLTKYGDYTKLLLAASEIDYVSNNEFSQVYKLSLPQLETITILRPQLHENPHMILYSDLMNFLPSLSKTLIIVEHAELFQQILPFETTYLKVIKGEASDSVATLRSADLKYDTNYT